MVEKKDASYLIVGAGEFGARAVKTLNKKYPAAPLTVVDEDQGALDRLEDFVAETVCSEGASYLEQLLDKGPGPDWIIPAAPIHVAFEWIRAQLARTGSVEVIAVPVEVEAMLPNPKRGSEGQLFISYADFRCPEHCTEPYDLCTWTGKPRKGLLYRTVGEIVFEDYRSIVLRSRQLAPGVGGYQSEALRKSLDEVTQAPSPVLYTTACLCHGVMHAFKIS
jgi:threonine dehydrogenase-like Zn-dependent dehydrogenase